MRTIIAILTAVEEIVAHQGSSAWLSQDSMLDRLVLEKSLCCERLSSLSLSPVYPLSAPLSPCHTHTQTHSLSHTLLSFTHLTIVCCNNCLLRPPLFPAHSGKMTCLMAEITALSTFSVSSAASTPQPEGGGGVGGVGG